MFGISVAMLIGAAILWACGGRVGMPGYQRVPIAWVNQPDRADPIDMVGRRIWLTGGQWWEGHVVASMGSDHPNGGFAIAVVWPPGMPAAPLSDKDSVNVFGRVELRRMSGAAAPHLVMLADGATDSADPPVARPPAAKALVAAAALPAAAGIILSLIRRWLSRRPWRFGPGRCRQCGYDVRSATDRCPECGTPVGRSPSPAEGPHGPLTGAGHAVRGDGSPGRPT